MKKIIAYLDAKKMDITPIDGYVTRFIGMPQQGWIYIGKERLTHGDFLYKLVTAKAAMRDFTLIPGETTHFFLKNLAQKMELDEAQLIYYSQKISDVNEGAYVPDTYKLPIGISEKDVILLFVNRSKKRMKEYSKKIFGKYDEKKWQQYIIKASVIQKEAASIEDMTMVSSVISNRLRKGMKLQMDGTLNYGEYSHSKVTAFRIRNDESRYNTYMYNGLPKNAVCNVGFDAIKAAIFPAKTSYLYFVRTKKRHHSYSSNYSTHLKYIKSATN
ncbi:MAG: endolytic transglycosylase MltG [Campylobacterota bacterium]|nr:endolytic transglycosylase MltG [Campylobacterota bacterium]